MRPFVWCAYSHYHIESILIASDRSDFHLLILASASKVTTFISKHVQQVCLIIQDTTEIHLRDVVSPALSLIAVTVNDNFSLQSTSPSQYERPNYNTTASAYLSPLLALAIFPALSSTVQVWVDGNTSHSIRQWTSGEIYMAIFGARKENSPLNWDSIYISITDWSASSHFFSHWNELARLGRLHRKVCRAWITEIAWNRDV